VWVIAHIQEKGGSTMMTTLRLAIFVLYAGFASMQMYSVWGRCFPVGRVRPDLRFSPGVKELVAGIVQAERSKRVEEFMFDPPIDVFLSVNESALVEHKKELLEMASSEGDRALLEMLDGEDSQTRKNLEALMEQNGSGCLMLVPGR
jgi:hypothetical protein